MRKLLFLIVGCLAVIGAVVLAVNVGWNVGAISACGAAKETASPSLDGKFVLVMGVSDCGALRQQTMARILSSTGKTYLVFLGSAKSQDPILSSQWLSASELQLSYSSSATVEFPPADSLDSLNQFGDVEVQYNRL